MKKLIFVILVLFLFASAFSHSQTLDDYLDKEQKIKRNSMITLISWGGVNLMSGIIGWRISKGESHYFHQMNASWGLINAGIGTTALLIQKDQPTTLKKALNKSHRTEKILYLNTGLDVAYLTAGFALKSVAKNNPENVDRFRGFGNSLLLQGGFLLLFDITQLIIHNRHRKLNEQDLWNNLSLSDTGVGVIYTIKYH